MPLSDEISEVLIKIKGDYEFHRPLKIPSNPPYKYEGKYSNFHE
jgi:hypothetical protein